jgi:hypothetical protein
MIFQDKKDNFWFGREEKGVYRYDGEKLVLLLFEEALNKFGEPISFALCLEGPVQPELGCYWNANGTFGANRG